MMRFRHPAFYKGSIKRQGLFFFKGGERTLFAGRRRNMPEKNIIWKRFQKIFVTRHVQRFAGRTLLTSEEPPEINSGNFLGVIPNLL